MACDTFVALSEHGYITAVMTLTLGKLPTFSSKTEILFTHIELMFKRV